jgi:hypothetical protein
MELSAHCSSRAGEIAPCPHPSCTTNITISADRHHNKTRYILKHKIHLYSALTHEASPKNLSRYITQDHIIQTLAALPHFVCSHVSLSDPNVLKAFSWYERWGRSNREAPGYREDEKQVETTE